jgi:RHS repeat-associated protein
VYDSAGNLTRERTRAGVQRDYTWDAADRLTAIADTGGSSVSLTYDPLDRLRTRTVGSDVQTVDYLGVGDDVWRQAGNVTSSGLLDADGSRVGTRTGSTGAWLLFDLLGSVAAAEGTGSTAISDALRYDAWGQTLGLYHQSGESALTTRFRGLVDIAPTADPDVSGPGSDPLYVMGARSYSPHTGSFISLDSYAGAAIDPATLHRYLYAHANPTTLIDPTGHAACEFDPCEPTPSPEWVERETNPSPPPTPNQSGSPDERSGGTTSTDQQQTSGGNAPTIYRGIPLTAEGGPVNLSDMYRLGDLCSPPYEMDEVACDAYEIGLKYVPGANSEFDPGLALVVIGGVVVCVLTCAAIAAGAATGWAALTAGEGLVAALTVACIRACQAGSTAVAQAMDIACGCLTGGEIPANGVKGTGVDTPLPTKYPPNRGFAGDPAAVTLGIGAQIDRYGPRSGHFVSPTGTPFEQRSLEAHKATGPYESYRVVKPIEQVNAGRTVPWFDQPGGGIQYELQESVEWLLEHGYLEVES